MKIKKALIVFSVILAVFLLVGAISIYGMLRVRRWRYAYYGKSTDGSIECEVLLTRPTYKSLRFYLYFKQCLKSEPFSGKVWIKTNKNHGEYIYARLNNGKFASDINRFIVNPGRWEKSGDAFAKENFIAQTAEFDLPVSVSFSAPFSEKKLVTIRMKKVPVRMLPYVPPCDADNLTNLPAVFYGKTLLQNPLGS